MNVVAAACPRCDPEVVSASNHEVTPVDPVKAGAVTTTFTVPPFDSTWNPSYALLASIPWIPPAPVRTVTRVFTGRAEVSIP